LEQAQPVALFPVLRELSVDQAIDANAGDPQALAGRRDAQDGPVVRALGREAGDRSPRERRLHGSGVMVLASSGLAPKNRARMSSPSANAAVAAERRMVTCSVSGPPRALPATAWNSRTSTSVLPSRRLQPTTFYDLGHGARELPRDN